MPSPWVDFAAGDKVIMRTRRGHKLARVGKVFENLDNKCASGYEDDDSETEANDSDEGSYQSASRSRAQPPC